MSKATEQPDPRVGDTWENQNRKRVRVIKRLETGTIKYARVMGLAHGRMSMRDFKREYTQRIKQGNDTAVYFDHEDYLKQMTPAELAELRLEGHLF